MPNLLRVSQDALTQLVSTLSTIGVDLGPRDLYAGPDFGASAAVQVSDGAATAAKQLLTALHTDVGNLVRMVEHIDKVFTALDRYAAQQAGAGHAH